MTSAFTQLTYNLDMESLHLRLACVPLQENFGKMHHTLRTLASMLDHASKRPLPATWLLAGPFYPVQSSETAALAVVRQMGDTLQHHMDRPNGCTVQRILTRPDYMWLAGWHEISPFGKARMPVRMLGLGMATAFFIEPVGDQRRTWRVHSEMDPRNVALAYG